MHYKYLYSIINYTIAIAIHTISVTNNIILAKFTFIMIMLSFWLVLSYV